MIEMGKQYKTRDGRKARVLCTDGPDADYPVVAVVEDDMEGWTNIGFTADGHYYDSDLTGCDDLIEVKPEITRWVIAGKYLGYGTQEEAQEEAQAFFSECEVSVVPVTFRAGEGL